VGIFRANSQGQVDYWNERLDSLTGMTVDEIRGQSWTQAVHPDDRQRVADEWDRCAHDQAVFKLQFRMVHQRGTVTWAVGEAMAMMDPSGRVTGYVGTITDIGDLKQAEEHLRATLEDLTRSNRDLEQFAYVASHDLQEPLRMVSSYTQLLAERYQNQLDQDANDFIAFAVDGAKRMQRLINDLLAYSRIGRRSSAPVRLDSSAVCQQALINLAPAIAESGAVVTCDPLPTVVADEILLIQVFQNLIGNAVKFRRPDTPPRVHVGYRREGAEWVFSVRDNGIGIAPEYFSRLFVIFQRLHAKGEYPGTGIGLAICKRIVERHGGRIWLESAPGQGATFLFSFPAV
jgi:PAS domain S-box-containing protein